MALETLENVSKIGSENVGHHPSNWETDGTPEYIKVNHNTNTVSFTIQNGPIKENGKNGCQLIDMVATAKNMLEKLNTKFPCRENAMTITKLDEALMWQEKRTKDREDRNVEGYSKQ